MNGNEPLTLFPLKIETRFDNSDLKIRVFPDEPFLQSHTHAISEQEEEDIITFKEINDESDKLKWRRLVKKYGVYRASYLVRLSESESELNQVKGLTYSEDKVFCFKWVPNRFKFFIHFKEDGIPKKIVKEGELIDEDNLHLLGDDEGEDNWLISFNKAVDYGMAAVVPIGSIDVIDRIVVTGIREKGEGITDLKELILNHQHTKGFSLLDYGTPTNNFENQRSQYSHKDKYETESSFEYVVAKDITNNEGEGEEEAEGDKLARAFGLNQNEFKNIQNASNVESTLLKDYQQATWFTMGGQSLRMLCGDAMTADVQQWLWQYYSNYVKSRGPLSSIKIGNQPYGIIPVMAYNKNNLPKYGGPILANFYRVLIELFEVWKEMANDNEKIPKAKTQAKGAHSGDPYQELYEVLNMQECSVELQLRVRKYSKISSSVPGWLGEKFNIPTPIPTLPPELLYKLLEGRQELSGYMDQIKARRASLEFLSTFLNSNSKREYDYNLSLKDDLDHSEYLVVESESIAEKTIQLKLTEDIEGLEILQSIFVELNNPDRKDVLNFQSKQPSLFADFILRGIAKAFQLYKKIIYFQPTIEELKTFKFFRVKLPKGKESYPLIITDGEKELTIKSPFLPKIEWSVKDGDEVIVGQPLGIAENTFFVNIIKDMFSKLGKRLIDELNGLSAEKSHKVQKRIMLEVMDLSSYRLDAWMTSLATHRLETIRKNAKFKNKTGLGAYGWVENIHRAVKNNDQSNIGNKRKGGIIHCPTPTQSLVATLYKNSFLTHLNEEGEATPNPFTLNLTSDRIQRSSRLMEGIRQGQSVEALLGYQLERYLHDNQLDSYIYKLRKEYPLEVNIINRGDNNPDIGFDKMSTIDGLKIIDAKASLDEPDLVKIGIDLLENILDGSADLLYYETGMQYMQGNYDRAAAAMEASVGKVEPPEPESIKTPIPGVGVNHKIVLVFEEAKTVSITHPKAYLEQSIEQWLRTHLGEMKHIGFYVNVFQGGEIYKSSNNITPILSREVTLSDLNLCYSDLLYLSDTPVSDNAGELERLIWNFVKTKEGLTEQDLTYKIIGEDTSKEHSLTDALEWLKYAFSLLSHGRYLKSDDLTLPTEQVRYDKKELKKLRKRIDELNKEVQKKLAEGDVAYLSKFNFQEAKHSYLMAQDFNVEKLKKEVEQKNENKVQAHLTAFDGLNLADNYYQAFEELSKAAKILFGPSFILLPPVLTSKTYTESLSNYDASKVIGVSSKDDELTQFWGQERVQEWIDKLAQVNKGTAIFEEWQMVNTAWLQEKAHDFEFKVLQGHTVENTHWIGLSEKEINNLRSKLGLPDLEKNFYPQNSSSTVLYAPSSLTFQQKKKGQLEDENIPVYGLVIDEFSEHIPNRTLSTGLSFHYNPPNAEAPQAWLIAVKNQEYHDDSPWTEEDLADIVNDTLDLSKIRMMDLEALKDFGFVLPMIGYFDIPPAN